MAIDYDLLSRDYDLTRNINMDIVKRILLKITIDKDSFVLDFGCGTGSYACAIKKLTDATVFGVEPSDGMREKAQAKSSEVIFKKGDHTSIPFEKDYFDLIYMTDVIHHVPDLGSMFAEFFRVLKQDGEICILTESHKQIETRFWSVYFPATITNERERYPDIPDILSSAGQCGFIVDENTNTDHEQAFTILPEFIQLIENKGFSMFRLISDEDFTKGLERLKKDYENNITIKSNHGNTTMVEKSLKRYLLLHHCPMTSYNEGTKTV